MLAQQKIFAVLLSTGLIVLVFELVRRRKLREEYSWLWMLTSLVILILAVWHDLLLWVTHLIGAALPTSTLFFLGVFFLILISLYFSVKISTLTVQVNRLVQNLAILSQRIERESQDKKE